jgi:hypothetical protein
MAPRTEKAKKWHKENAERVKAKNREWVENNRGRVAAASARWREKNPEKLKAAEADRWKRDKVALTEKSYKWREKNPGEWSAINRKASLKKYGLTPTQYADMVNAQKGLCEICGSPPTDIHSSVLCVDHDHQTGAVRGLLCHKCNGGMGLFMDNPDTLRKAAAYLDRHARRKVA